MQKRKAPSSKKVSMTSEQAKEKISKIKGSMFKADAKYARFCVCPVTSLRACSVSLKSLFCQNPESGNAHVRGQGAKDEAGGPDHVAQDRHSRQR
jgi:hypothetical protein